MNLEALAAEFPREAVHWRAQTLTRNGDKALALAYLDARDVMDRLDAVCGPSNWQSEITETPKGRVICRLGIRIGDQWVWKSDGAGDTAVEGEKGGISDALKRAAVHWGVGRYLYRLDSVWAPCETKEKNGKMHWSKWRGSPWDSVRAPGKPPANPPEAPAKPANRNARQLADHMIAAMVNCKHYAEWQDISKDRKFIADLEWLEGNAAPMAGEVKRAKSDAKLRIDPAGQAA